jgi:hypothetical protein
LANVSRVGRNPGIVKTKTLLKSEVLKLQVDRDIDRMIHVQFGSVWQTQNGGHLENAQRR